MPIWNEGRLRPLFMIPATLVLIAGFAAVYLTGVQSRTPYFDQQIEAARLMRASLDDIKELRLSLGVSIDSRLDPNGTGIIGAELTETTTTLGDIEAKRTSSNPAFAALMVSYFKQAHLKPGDTVAVGSSGSFPALAVAVLSAARVLELHPILIYSMGASMYGANIPGLNFAVMLDKLNADGLLPYELAAVSPGGDGDAGGGTMLGDGRQTLLSEARSCGAPLILADSVADSIRRRLALYDSAGGPVKCFVNVGGASPNYGTTSASLRFPNGLVLRGPSPPADPERGLIYEYAARGLPVINLLNVKDLALKNGLPVDPAPLPEIGSGGVYYTTKYNRWWIAGVLFLGCGLLAHGVRRR